MAESEGTDPAAAVPTASGLLRDVAFFSGSLQLLLEGSTGRNRDVRSRPRT